MLNNTNAYAKQLATLQTLLQMQQHYATKQHCAKTQAIQSALANSIQCCYSKLRYIQRNTQLAA
jgi:hypothetical protein